MGYKILNIKIMSEKFEPNEQPKMAEVIEKLRQVESFETDHGSVYSYDDEGHMSGTQRSTEHTISGELIKATTGKNRDKIKEEKKEKQSIAVFGYFHEAEIGKYEETFKPGDKNLRGRIYILEKRPDNSTRIIEDISEVENPDELYLVVMKNGKVESHKKATLIPKEEYNHFDWRNFVDKDGEKAHERSFGGKVTKINYKNK